METIPCARCSSPTEISQNFCSNCGTSLTRKNTLHSPTDKIVLTAIILLVFQALYWFGIRLFVKFTGTFEIYENLEYLSNFISIIVIAVPLLLSFSIRNVSLKTLGIILSIVFALIQIYWLAQALFNF